MTIEITLDVNGRDVRIWSYHDVTDAKNDSIDIFVDVDGDTLSGQLHTLDYVRTRLDNAGCEDYFYDLYSVIVPTLTAQTIEQTTCHAVEEIMSFLEGGPSTPQMQETFTWYDQRLPETPPPWSESPICEYHLSNQRLHPSPAQKVTEKRRK